MQIEIKNNDLLIKFNDDDTCCLCIPLMDMNQAHIVKMVMEVYAEKKLTEHLTKMMERRQNEKDNDYH